MAILLYDVPMSHNARKVRLLAAELGLPIERRTLDFQKGETRTAAYLAKNPNGKVPTLEDDGFVLWESSAILKYLAAKKPERGLLPANAREQAQVDQWLFWWHAHPEAALELLLIERMIKLFLGKPGNDPGIVAHAEAQLARFLPVLDRQLAGRDFILGGLTVVDFAMGGSLDGADRLKVDLKPYANITAWLGRLRAKPYWREA